MRRTLPNRMPPGADRDAVRRAQSKLTSVLLTLVGVLSCTALACVASIYYLITQRYLLASAFSALFVLTLWAAALLAGYVAVGKTT
jgi:hypothetical protein